jgi:hypothetical protein
MKIEWNWGTKLVIAMAAFMIMIISMVVVMISQDISLVEKDYYPKGQAYQEMIKKVQNAEPYKNDIEVTINNEKLLIQFPEFFKPSATTGFVQIYHRISDTEDHYARLVLNENGIFTFPLNELKGRYILKMHWQQEGVEYYTENNLTVE